MPDSTVTNLTFSLGLYNAPSGRVDVEALGPDSALAGMIALRPRTDAQGHLGHLYLTPAQARQLRLQLSLALEGYYREHPEELGADIERDLTMELVPDLPDPDAQLQESRELLALAAGLTAEEVEALAYLRAEAPVFARWRIPGVAEDRVSLINLVGRGLIYDPAAQGYWLTERGREVLKFFDGDLVQPVSVDEAVQRG